MFVYVAVVVHLADPDGAYNPTGTFGYQAMVIMPGTEVLDLALQLGQVEDATGRGRCTLGQVNGLV